MNTKYKLIFLLSIAFIPFRAKKLGGKSYWITLQKQLAPGEYAITIDGAEKFSTGSALINI